MLNINNYITYGTLIQEVTARMSVDFVNNSYGLEPNYNNDLSSRYFSIFNATIDTIYQEDLGNFHTNSLKPRIDIEATDNDPQHLSSRDKLFYYYLLYVDNDNSLMQDIKFIKYVYAKDLLLIPNTNLNSFRLAKNDIFYYVDTIYLISTNQYIDYINYVSTSVYAIYDNNTGLKRVDKLVDSDTVILIDKELLISAFCYQFALFMGLPSSDTFYQKYVETLKRYKSEINETLVTSTPNKVLW